MNKYIGTHFLIAFLFTCTLLSGQNLHQCGTDGTMNVLRLQKHIQNMELEGEPNRMTRYVPIKFHLVGENDGSGRIKYSSVLKQLCKLRKDFEKFDMIPYISGGFSHIDHTGINNTPNTNSSIFTMNGFKVSDAVNIYVVKSADDGSNIGTILGYYDPSNDFIVIRSAEVRDSTESLSHELGHYFSLNHPFFGWENTPYDIDDHGNPVNINSINGFPIELVNGTNCNNSGDFICDTPPDYLFSFSESVQVTNCNMTTNVFDKNGDQIEPMENNMMSYFDCVDYEFTPDQITMMAMDFESPSRAGIRTGYVPNTNEVTEEIEIISPSHQSIEDVYNEVFLDWTDVAHADMYLVEMKDVFSGLTYQFFTDESELLVKELDADTKISWFVQGINEAYGCNKTNSITFDTGLSSNVSAEESSINEVHVVPNPSNVDQQVNVQLKANMTEIVDLEVFTISGQKVYQLDQYEVNTGTNWIPLHYDFLKGIYILKVKYNDNQSCIKFAKQ